jgi:methylmalonyl-CoA mutase N-terminal domain/subunit
VRAERDSGAVDRALSRLQEAARGTDNLMYPILESVKAYATLGEICDVFRQVFGEYQEPVYF